MDIWRYDGQEMICRRDAIHGNFTRWMEEQGYASREFGAIGSRDRGAHMHQRVSGIGPAVLLVVVCFPATWVVECDGLGEMLELVTNKLAPFLDKLEDWVDVVPECKPLRPVLAFMQKKC